MKPVRLVAVCFIFCLSQGLTSPGPGPKVSEHILQSILKGLEQQRAKAQEKAEVIEEDEETVGSSTMEDLTEITTSPADDVALGIQLDIILDRYENSAPQPGSNTTSSGIDFVIDLIRGGSFNLTLTNYLINSDEFCDLVKQTFFDDEDFKNVLLLWFVSSEVFRSDVLQQFNRVRSEQSQMIISQATSVILKQFSTSAEFQESLLEEFHEDESFALATLQEWAEDKQFRTVLLEVFLKTEELEDRVRQRLAESEAFCFSVTQNFIISYKFRNALIEEFANTNEFLGILSDLFVTSQEFKGTLLESFVTNHDYRDAVLNQVQFIIGDNQFEVVFLKQMVDSEQFEETIISQFSVSPQFRASTLELLCGIAQFQSALVSEFAQSDQFDNTISASLQFVDAALERFGDSSSFRDAVMETYYL